jgi:adenine phosphoribosyltransferase
VSFRDDLLARFRWIDGHADILGLFAKGAFLVAASETLAAPFETVDIAKVAAVEARGFIFGTAVAMHLGVGFVPIRKAGAIHPGSKAVRQAGPDWRGNQPTLTIQRAALRSNERVLLVDDWIETGSQALAARGLIEDCGAQYAGLSVLVDQSSEEVRNTLLPVAYVVSSAELPPQ